MSGLKALQTHFQDYLLDKRNALRDEVNGPNQKYKEVRLQIYKEAYFLRLHEVMVDDFPGLVALLDDEAFEKLCQAYLAKYPSHYFSVRDIATDFIEFLQQTSPYQEQPYLAQMAAFEWALLNVVDAANAPIKTRADLSTIAVDDWPYLQFRMHPASQLLSLQYNIVPIWQAVEANKEMPAIETNVEPVIWLIWRKHNQAYFYSCDASKLCFINGLAEGITFSEICERLSCLMPESDVPEKALGLLLELLDDELISTLKL